MRYELLPIDDISSSEPATYGGNPALKMPVMRHNGAVLFGAENICRRVAEICGMNERIVWPEQLHDDLWRNAQQLAWHCMVSQVQLIVGTLIAKLPAGNVFFAKARTSLEGSLDWLDANVTDAIARLPEERTLSLFEVSLFCLVEHLEFRPTVGTDDYPALLRFAHEFGRRTSAHRTAYR